jgi:hypothetical protein
VRLANSWPRRAQLSTTSERNGRVGASFRLVVRDRLGRELDQVADAPLDPAGDGQLLDPQPLAQVGAGGGFELAGGALPVGGEGHPSRIR